MHYFEAFRRLYGESRKAVGKLIEIRQYTKSKDNLTASNELEWDRFTHSKNDARSMTSTASVPSIILVSSTSIPCEDVGRMRVSANRRSLILEAGRYRLRKFGPGWTSRRTTQSPLLRGILKKSIIRKIVLVASEELLRRPRLYTVR